MAISTYAELQAAAANWLIRSDLTARIPEFITLAEARLNRELRKRQAEVDVSLTGVVDSRFIPLPGAYSEALAMWILYPQSTERDGLKFVEPAQLTVYTTSSRPYAWTIDGANIAFERPCDQAYAFTLRCLETYALSDAAPTNTLLTDAPDVYLFAVLAEAGPFLRDADLTSAYETKVREAMQSLNTKDARSRAQQTLPTEFGRMQASTRRHGYSVYRDS